ncbi:hypothetical protein [Leptolyngbya sp. KIOST-1]|uniref:HD domain-containing protein n=1 Tax=Leptolyngbya sp. KIOST-1 TaxID=1229172 RepID=UPI0006893610|nr:hypothetical protein [Leptolyngbya sp. KIOST-1]
MPGRLGDRWHTLWRSLHLPAPAVLGQLCDRYTEPHRAYHTLQHLRDCLAWCDRSTPCLQDPAAVELALWFHDGIYDPHCTDNEEQSADWAVRVIASVGGSLRLQQTVHGMILATRHHNSSPGGDIGAVLDSDLAILGASPCRFKQYEAQIRQEYAWVPEAVFRHRRAELMRAFLARPAIFGLDFFRSRLEQQARHNLQASLAALQKTSRPPATPAMGGDQVSKGR